MIRRRDLDTVINSQNQEGISPELEEKIHEMQVSSEHSWLIYGKC